MPGTNNDQLFDAINGLTRQVMEMKEEIKFQNGRVHTLEQWRVTAAVDTALYQKEINDQLAEIKPVTQEVTEILGFTRTTGKIAKWVTAIGTAGAAVAGLVAIIQGGLT